MHLLNHLKERYRIGFARLLSLTLFVLLSGVSVAQVTVSGRVTDDTGEGLPGVNILESGTSNGTITDIDGYYSLLVTADAEVNFSFTGFEGATIEAGSGGTFDIVLAIGAEILDEVVVTGYQIQRKRDITGAVAVVDAEDLKTVAASSFTQKLQGRATGVTTSTSGAPGDATNVRIRGISSFGNNDPLYIIDGVPVESKYNNNINPGDIETIQVLKDASAASIYGSRASNGVVIITTKKGKAGKTKVTYDGYVGTSSPVGSYSDILITNSNEYIQMVQEHYDNGGITRPDYAINDAPTTYIFPVGENVDESTYDPTNNPIMKTNQSGTDWWDESFQNGLITDHTLSVSGGGENGVFNFSMGYLKQEGTLIHTDFDRFSVRANSEFKAGERFRFGENLSLSRSSGINGSRPGNGNQSEQGVITQIVKISPLVPVKDINGNWGGSKASGLGNGDNPVATLTDGQNNRGTYYNVLGNMFAEVDILKSLTFRTSFGINYQDDFISRFNFPTPQNNEPTLSNGFSENWDKSFGWTWSNTLNWRQTFNDRHAVSVLAGYEAVKTDRRNINGSLSNYFVTDINAWYLVVPFSTAPDSRGVGSGGSQSTLASLFGKVDYSFDDKYILSATVRRDGSSRFSEKNRYGVFPAFSAGWRISGEDFMQDVSWISDLKIRGGWGVTGNQNIADYNYSDRFGSDRIGQTGYDINGTNNSTATGFALVARGNADTKWEENTSINFGLDATLFNDKFTLIFDWYQRKTTDLLYQSQLPGTAGSAQAPFLNIGGMQNTGIDLGLGYRTPLGSKSSLDIMLNISQYTNEITSINGESDFFYPTGVDNRLPTEININQLGNPLSSFYGYQTDGLFASQEELDAIDQPGAVIGGIRFKDLNGDMVIGDADQTIIGSPHPDLTLGLNLAFTISNFDITAFFFGSFGNEIFNYNKLFTDFRQFNANASRDRWQNAGTGNTPILSISDQSSRNSSDYYVEDGSYFRMSQFQVGYTLPSSVTNDWGMDRLRFYIQAQNLFTITNYSGVDPALSSANIGSDSNLNDQWTGYDFGNYPSSKVFSFGISAGF